MGSKREIDSGMDERKERIGAMDHLSWYDEYRWSELLHGIRAAIIVISPALAELLLQFNTKNRNQKINAIKRYADDMCRDQWKLTGEPIIFGITGRLINGQNRLVACVQSGHSFETLVLRNVPDEHISQMDSGAMRKVSDALTLRGHISATCITAAAGWIWRYEQGILRGGNNGATVAQVDEVIDAYPELPAIATWSTSKNQEWRGLGGPSIHAAFLCIGKTVNNDDSIRFWERLADGSELSKQSPMLLYRQLYLNNSTKKARQFSNVTMAATLIKAWNAYVNKLPMNQLSWKGYSDNKPEQFPVMIGHVKRLRVEHQ